MQQHQHATPQVLFRGRRGMAWGMACWGLLGWSIPVWVHAAPELIPEMPVTGRPAPTRPRMLPTRSPLDEIVERVDTEAPPLAESWEQYDTAQRQLTAATEAHDHGRGDVTGLVTADLALAEAELALLATALPLLTNHGEEDRAQLRAAAILDIRLRARDRAFRIWRRIYVIHLASGRNEATEDEALAREHYLACRHRFEQALVLSPQ